MRSDSPTAAARRRLRRGLRTALWRGRFVLVALCCGLAATATAQVLRPEPPPTVEVVVPVHPLAAGKELDAGDLTVRTVPAALVPRDVLTDPGDAVGRVPAVDLPAGLPLHATLVAGGGLVARAPEGTVVVPVRLDDAASGLLRPGDRVDLVAADAGTRHLARRALVLPGLPRGAGEPGPGPLLGGAAGGTDAPVTLVAVAPEEAPALSAASGHGIVSAVLVR